MEQRIAAALASTRPGTIEEKLKHMPAGTPGREKVIAHLAEVKEQGKSIGAPKGRKSVFLRHYSALDGQLELKNGTIRFRGAEVNSYGFEADFEKLLGALKKKYGASEIDVTFHDPDGVNAYRYPTVAITVIFPGNAGKDIKAGREIARAVYLFGYPPLKKSVWLDVWNRPQSDRAEEFFYSYMIPPGTDPDAYSAYLFSKDQVSRMKNKRWVH